VYINFQVKIPVFKGTDVIKVLKSKQQWKTRNFSFASMINQWNLWRSSIAIIHLAYLFLRYLHLKHSDSTYETGLQDAQQV